MAEHRMAATTPMAPIAERAVELIRRDDDGRGWSREDRVLQHLGGGAAAEAVVHDLAASGDILREIQTWSMLNDNYEPTGELRRGARGARAADGVAGTSRVTTPA